MPQFGRPTTDTTREAWEEDDGTTVDIWDQIDEAVADDLDFIRSAQVPTTDAYVTKLGTLTDPLQSTSHVVRYRYGKDTAAGAQINLVVELRQAYVSEASQGTLIASLTHTDVASGWTAGTFTLSGAEADAITDYTNLYVRITANQI